MNEKDRTNQLMEDLDVIGNVLGDVEETLAEGLPEGPHSSEWNYDEKLVSDIAAACRAWQERNGHE